MNSEKIYLIALSKIKNIGSVTGRSLISYLGSAENVFKAKKQQLMKAPGVGELIADIIIQNKSDALKWAEEELKRVEEHKLKLCFFNDNDYPTRLKMINDSPLYFYYQGENVWNADRTIAIVGTRKPTAYGKDLVTKFVKDISEYGVVIVSGLAHGIDTIAHQEALKNNLKTIAVLGNGLPDIYPSNNTRLAQEIIYNGCVISEYPIFTEPEAPNFPKRNRIVAGMVDAVIVVESKTDGGSIITASIANSYHKDVFAFPGRTNDLYSSGCNALIKLQKAQMIENAEDFLYFMNWRLSNKPSKSSSIAELPLSLNPEQEIVFNLLREKNRLHIDEISYLAQLSNSRLSMILLEMEMNNWIRSLPGKMYELCV
ncbi:MAG TPA: DNA-processing protein DprA [Bacteroidia bacterium]|nr:DNA-processing protein DprA [Bacteroidia bacterium]